MVSVLLSSEKMKRMSSGRGNRIFGTADHRREAQPCETLPDRHNRRWSAIPPEVLKGLSGPTILMSGSTLETAFWIRGNCEIDADPGRINRI